MTTKTRFVHPELRDGEVFLTNTSEIAEEDGRNGWDMIGWKSKRRGLVAYNMSSGKSIGGQWMFPVFVRRAEVEAAGFDPETLTKRN